jgi:hypothetical protein
MAMISAAAAAVAGLVGWRAARVSELAAETGAEKR